MFSLNCRNALVVAGCITSFSLIPQDGRAQIQATTGLIRGIVADTAGRPLHEAGVVLHQLETNYTRVVTTSSRGAFAAPLLPLGTYDITVRAMGYHSGSRSGVVLHLGQTVELGFALIPQAVMLPEIVLNAASALIDPAGVQAATRFLAPVVERLPNNGRNYLSLVLLTPHTGIVQGPDGDELSIEGQRGIHNNVSVDGADFNNPFFGEQRGGQRPAFTFNLDAVDEVVVVSQGAPAEFGRSSSGFINVVTKSGSNTLQGSTHYFGKFDDLSANAVHDSLVQEPRFSQHQFGFTLGGPLRRDRLFFFSAYDQQVYAETKHLSRPQSAALDSLIAWSDTAFGGALGNDFGPLHRSNNANALLVKLDWTPPGSHRASLKYNYTNSNQENGTFDVPTWGRSANARERDISHALNGSLISHLGQNVTNEFRFQWARENRPRPYEGPDLPGTSRHFPDTGMDVVNGFRIGMPFFIPVQEHDTRIQLLNNLTWVRNNHVFKGGIEWNRTSTDQVFLGFANGRFIFNSVTGFINYVQFGSGYVNCSNGPDRTDGQCPGGQITGPVLRYIQQAGVDGRPVEETGTQTITQHELAAFLEDSWTPGHGVTLNYGVRWEAQIEPGPITPPEQVFFAPFIGQRVTTAAGTFFFPSNGEIPSDWTMFQPRLGLAWDLKRDGSRVIRASIGEYYARIPALNIAGVRNTNGSIGQRLVRSSASIPVFGRPPAYDSLLVPAPGAPTLPDIVVADRGLRNPRTWSGSVEYGQLIGRSLSGYVEVTHARTDFLTRFVNRNDPVFGQPWRTGLGPGGTNGINQLTVVESSARSRYTGVTLGLRSQSGRALEFELNYTLSFDKSDDDNERDPFTFRYARADSLAAEFGWSDRDQRHRFNAWMLLRGPAGVRISNRVSAYSAQPVSEACGPDNRGSGKPATQPSNRICPDGHILRRNTLRKDNAFFSWDLRLSRDFSLGGGMIEAVLDVFNLTNADNFRDPAVTSLLFNFDGTLRSGLGEPRQVQAGLRWLF